MRKILFLPLLALSLALNACGEKKPAAPDAAKPAAALSEAAPVTAAPSNLSGKELHDANCISCHDSSKYTRADHKMQDFAMLSAQVKRCDANLGAKLFDEDIDKIINYMNDTYYKFPK
jgi:cytochrome c5